MFCFIAAAQLAQLDKRRSAEREVAGFNPGQTEGLGQHSGSYNNWGECAAFAGTSTNG